MYLLSNDVLEPSSQRDGVFVLVCQRVNDSLYTSMVDFQVVPQPRTLTSAALAIQGRVERHTSVTKFVVHSWPVSTPPPVHVVVGVGVIAATSPP